MLIYYYILFCLYFTKAKYLNGLLIYNYEKMYNYDPPFVNIGDYIQSLAAKQFIKNKNNIIYLNRDNLKDYSGNKIKFIFNCWFIINDKTINISNNLIPLFISFHISNLNNIYKMKKILKKYEPIGARDIDTMNALEKNGIKSYYSSCLTLTLGKTYKVQKKKILFI